jgi:hypothetical protein
MSGAESSLAGLPAGVGDPDLQPVLDLFRRDGRIAGLCWAAFRTEFDKAERSDLNHSAGVKAFAVRYALFLEEGA